MSIARNISSCFPYADLNLVGGSLGYGPNYAVTATSDIDYVLVCSRADIQTVARSESFLGRIETKAIRAFEDKSIGVIHMSREIGGVTVNFYVYHPEAYRSFCGLESSLQGYTTQQLQTRKLGYGFAGEEIWANRNVTPFGSGSTYTIPTLVDGKFWGVATREDYLIGAQVLHERDGFHKNMSEVVWSSTIKQLLKEYTSPDLSRVNIVNTIYAFQKTPQRVPTAVLEKVRVETQRRVGELKSLA